MNIIDKNSNINFHTKDKLNAYNEQRCKQLQAELWKEPLRRLKVFPLIGAGDDGGGNGLCGSIQILC